MDGSLILWITKTNIQGKKLFYKTTTAHTISIKSMYHLNSEGDTLSVLPEETEGKPEHSCSLYLNLE